MKNQKGQTLIEALIALGAAVVVISAIVVGAISSLSTTKFSSNSNLADQYAQEGMEFARHLAQQNWSSFSTYGKIGAISYCYDNNATSLVVKAQNTCALSQAPIFTRILTIDQTGGGECKWSAYILVTVAWKDGACANALQPFCHKVTLENCLSSVNAVTPP